MLSSHYRNLNKMNLNAISFCPNLFHLYTQRTIIYSILLSSQSSPLIYVLSTVTNKCLWLQHSNLFWLILRWHFISHKRFWYKILIYSVLSNSSSSELQLFNVKMYLYTMIYSESKTTIYDCNRFKLLYLCILLLFLWLTKDIPHNQTLMNNQCKTITEVEQVGGIHILHYFVGIVFTP